MFDFNAIINQPGAWVFLIGVYGVMAFGSLLTISFMLHKCAHHHKD